MTTIDNFKKAIRETALVRKESGAVIITSESSGERADWIFDFRALMLQPKWLDAYAEIFWERHAGTYPFQVGAMETAGIGLVAAIVMKGVQRGTPVNGFFIRKSRKRQGLMKQIEGTLTDDTIILVDDLMNSGSTFEKQIRVLKDAGKTVSGISAILRFRDTQAYDSFRNQNIRMDALFSLEDFGIPLIQKKDDTPVDSFETVWRFRAPDPSFHLVVQKSSPVIDEAKVYFGTDTGSFYALEQSNGEISWAFHTGKHPEGKGILSTPVLYKDTVFFGAYDGAVYALDTATGAVRWKNEDADWIGSSPALATDVHLLFVGLEFGLFKKRGGIAALDMKTGQRRWSDRTPSLTHGSPLYVREENMVTVGSNDGILYAYDAKTGERRWVCPTEGHIKMAPAYDAKRKLILCASMDGKIYALSAESGLPTVAYPTGGGLYTSPLVVGDTVYVASLDKSLYALDLDTWKPRWVYGTNGRIFASPVMHGTHIFIGSNDGRLHEVDAATGKRIGIFQATERIVGRPAFNEKNGLLFVPTVANEMYCLKKK
ncbi:PQQ-binding-like beta-propeller repeat protein [Candidatus Kaiserbacteria bacterium]|nr:PQQ-binding-like beta-propeller repeat protein [Candidatus Kaiserbacteria bacterium]